MRLWYKQSRQVRRAIQRELGAAALRGELSLWGWLKFWFIQLRQAKKKI